MLNFSIAFICVLFFARLPSTIAGGILKIRGQYETYICLLPQPETSHSLTRVKIKAIRVPATRRAQPEWPLVHRHWDLDRFLIKFRVANKRDIFDNCTPLAAAVTDLTGVSNLNGNLPR